MEKTSGKHTSRFADYNRHNVAASRGGMEGNNAFLKDCARNSGSYVQGGYALASPSARLMALFEEFDPVSLDFFQFVEVRPSTLNDKHVSTTRDPNPDTWTRHVSPLHWPRPAVENLEAPRCNATLCLGLVSSADWPESGF